MNIQERNAEEPTARSRFTYHGDEPTEGGVVSVRPGRENGAHNSGSRAHVAGAPGPDERLLDISELARTIGMHYTHVFAFPASIDGDLESVAPITGSVSMTNAGAALLLTGRVKTTVRLECGRCLAPTDLPVEAQLDEQFDLVASNNAFNQDDVQALDEDSPAAVISGNVLNLADLLRQNLLLAAPLQPLCREDCPGIVYEGAATVDSSGSNGSTGASVLEDNPLRRLAELLEAKRQLEAAAD